MKRLAIFLGIIIALFVALHFLLEPFVERFVNKQLSSLESYTGRIDDVDVHLFRGAYRIKSLVLEKREMDSDIPFLTIDTIDLSVQWNALFNGEIVGEVILNKPVVNMIVTQDIEGDSTQKQTGAEVDWTQQVQELIPLTINRFEVKNGNISYRDPSINPNVDAYFRKLYSLAENIVM